MAFTNPTGRYASFGVVSSIDPKIIDTIWDILDNYLKNVFPLDDRIEVHFQNRKGDGQLTILFYQRFFKGPIAFDYNYPFDPYGPEQVLLIDEAGEESLILPYELEI